MKQQGRRICGLTAFAGLAAIIYFFSHPPGLPVVKGDPRDYHSGSGDSGTPPPATTSTAASFDVDISALTTKLEELPEDERLEQIADWAVYGTLLQRGLDGPALQQATYDQAPFRDPALVEAVRYEYGEGRRVILAREVWLFYPAAAGSRRDAILSRLADQARMELGLIPASFRIYAFRPELRAGSIGIVEEQTLPGKELFTAKHGYIEAEVSDLAGFKQWLEQIDDLVYFERRDQSLLLGGRRHEGTRTQGATLDDVAAFYQAHAAIKADNEALMNELKGSLFELEKAVTNIQKLYNENVDAFNADNSAYLTDLDGRFAELDRLLGGTTANHSTPATKDDLASLMRRLQSPGSAPPKSAEMQRMLAELQRKQGGHGFTPPPSTGSGGRYSNHTRLERWEQRLSALKPEIEAEVLRRQEAFWTEKAREGKVPPSEPGFSLDPIWDAAGLVQDLKLLAKDPEAMVTEARELLNRERDKDYEKSATPRALSAAGAVLFVRILGDNPADGLQVSPDMKKKLETLISSVEGKTGKELEDGAIVPFLRLIAEKDDSEQDEVAVMILKFIQARRTFQHARYDGALQGTHAGMVMFYTDVLAKLWAALDYHDEAPVDKVLGFASIPRISAMVEPEFWEEEQRITATRLWFGTLASGFASAGDHDSRSSIAFSHVATRVFSLGHDPLNAKHEGDPTKEEAASESSRRVMDWWSRHYTRVADHEQQYHALNQLMKWSIVTGYFVEKGVGGFLKDVPVDRSLRFDTWYDSNQDLKFRHNIRFLDQSRWQPSPVAGKPPLETMEVLQSASFAAFGTSGMFMTGGVTGGGFRTLEEGTRIVPELSTAVRRGALKYDGSSTNLLKTLDGLNYKLAEGEGNLLRRTVVSWEAGGSKPVRFRPRGVDLKLEQLNIDLTSRQGRGAITVGTNRGAFGRLTSRPVDNGVKLGWRPGELATDIRRAKRIAGEAPEALASDPILNAQQGVSLLEKGEMAEAFVTRAAEAGKSPRFIGKAEDVSSEFIHTAAIEEPMESSFLSIRRIAASEASAATVSDRLQQYPWQKLQLQPTPGGQLEEGGIARIFTRTPGENGKAVKIETGISGMESLEGIVVDGAVYLKRPSQGNQQLFDELVERARLQTADLRRGLDEAMAHPDAPLRLAALPEPAGHAADSAAAKLADGDYASVTSGLRKAAKEKQLDQAIAHLDEDFQAQQIDRLMNGESTVHADRFTATLKEGNISGVREKFRREILQMHSGKSSQAGLDLFKTAFKDLDKATQNQLRTILARDGRAEMVRYLDLQTGRFPGAAPEYISHVELLKVGRSEHTHLIADGLIAQKKKLKPEDLRALLATGDGSDVYLKPARKGEKVLWEAEADVTPRHSLHRLLEEGQVTSIEEWTFTAGSGDFAPAIISEAGGKHVRIIQGLASAMSAAIVIGLGGDGGDDEEKDNDSDPNQRTDGDDSTGETQKSPVANP